MSRLLLALVLLSGACADGEDPAESPCTTEDRGDALSVGDRFGDFELTALDPAPPAVGLNQWTLAAGQSLDGCTVTAETFMPDHGHGSNIGAVEAAGESVEITDLDIIMGGYWEVTVTAACGEDDLEAVVQLCVDA